MSNFVDNYAESLAYRAGLGPDRFPPNDEELAADDPESKDIFLSVDDTILLTSHDASDSILYVEGD